MLNLSDLFLKVMVKGQVFIQYVQLLKILEFES